MSTISKYDTLDIYDLRTEYFRCLNTIIMSARNRHPDKSKVDESRAKMSDAYNAYPVMFVDTSIDILWKYRAYFDNGDIAGLASLNFDADIKSVKKTALERFNMTLDDNDNPADVLIMFKKIWTDMSSNEQKLIRKLFVDLVDIMRHYTAIN